MVLNMLVVSLRIVQIRSYYISFSHTRLIRCLTQIKFPQVGIRPQERAARRSCWAHGLLAAQPSCPQLLMSALPQTRLIVFPANYGYAQALHCILDWPADISDCTFNFYAGLNAMQKAMHVIPAVSEISLCI